MPTQEQVNAYISGAKRFMASLEKKQLIDMVILHFDIPDDKAKQMVEEALKVIK